MLTRDAAQKKKTNKQFFRNQIYLNHLASTVMLMNSSNTTAAAAVVVATTPHHATRNQRLCETSHGTDANELA